MKVITNQIERLIAIGKRTSFYDGWDNDFTRYLDQIVAEHGTLLVAALADSIAADKINPVQANEILRCIPDYETVALDIRLNMLTRFLTSPYVTIRDGATVGIASLADHRAMPYLARAIQREANHELRNDMQIVLDEIEGEGA